MHELLPYRHILLRWILGNVWLVLESNKFKVLLFISLKGHVKKLKHAT